MPPPAKTSATPTKKSSPAKPAESKSDAAAPAKSPSKSALTPAERMKMIAEAAYYLAEKRGFTGGNELSDWMAAEKQVDSVIAKRG